MAFVNVQTFVTVEADSDSDQDEETHKISVSVIHLLGLWSHRQTIKLIRLLLD